MRATPDNSYLFINLWCKDVAGLRGFMIGFGGNGRACRDQYFRDKGFIGEILQTVKGRQL